MPFRNQSGKQSNICFKFLSLLLLFSLSACNFPSANLSSSTPTTTQALTSTPGQTSTLTPTGTSTATLTRTPTPTSTSSASPAPSITPSQTVTLTAGPTLTPTYDFPDATVKMQAHCRYGPSTGYLHAADLYTGDHGTVRGRNNFATWLYVKFDKLDYFCWVAASVVDVVGDVMLVYPAERKLPTSVLYQAPENVQAMRNGTTVTVTWNRVDMTLDDDRGYMIEAHVCQAGRYLFVVVATNNTSYDFTDEAGCPLPSDGLLYTVEKHGYTDPATIPWPSP